MTTIKAEYIVRGGLGNQLFVILEAYRYLQKSGYIVALNLSEYEFNTRQDRPFEAGDFLPQIFTDFNVSIDFFSRLRYVLAKLIAKHKNLKVPSFRIPGDYACSFLTFSGSLVHIGYYQHIDSTQVDAVALERMKKIFSQSISSEYFNRLAVHVRRGDYLMVKHRMHGLLAISDLRDEARRALRNGGFDGITVFTDSPELLDKAEFESLGVDVSIDHGGKATDVLTRMASHAGIIASNSSFSLWAGLLGEPRYFSLPRFWMPSIESTRLGLNWVRRYPCTL